MSEKELHEKAVRLCEGGIVECLNLMVRAQVIDGDELACYDCEMDSICRMEMSDLCAECDGYEHKNHILKLAYSDRIR